MPHERSFVETLAKPGQQKKPANPRRQIGVRYSEASVHDKVRRAGSEHIRSKLFTLYRHGFVQLPGSQLTPYYQLPGFRSPRVGVTTDHFLRRGSN